MTKDELILKLTDIEWEDFEVKEARTNIPKNAWETVSAFSNTAGGWLIFGVKQSGKSFEITGVKSPEKIEQDFLTTLRCEKFNGKIVVQSKKYNLDKKCVLAFYIPVSDKKPVYFNSLKNTFIRTGSGDQRATQQEIDAMFRDQAFGTQTSRPAMGTSISSLNTASFERYRDYMTRFNPDVPYNRLKSDEFLHKTRIISDGHVTYSGLLFLGSEDAIADCFPDFRIDYLEIPGTGYENAEPRYTFRLDAQENIWEYYFAIFQRLRKYVDVPFQLTTEGFATEKSPALDAIREALVNLLMHTDYFSPAKPRIRVFTDRIEFFNPGALPKPLEIILKEDASIPRNPVLARLFRMVKLAESAGFGFDKMCLGWKETGADPLMDSGLDFFKITFPLVKRVGEKVGEGSQKGSQKSSQKIVELIKIDSKITISQMADNLGISDRAVKKHLRHLQKDGVIKREGPDKGGYWKILGERNE